VVGLAVALAVFSLSPRPASALLVSMPTYTQNPGDTFTVSVMLTASSSFTLDGYTLHIGFDPSKLAYLGGAGLGVFAGHPEFSLISSNPQPNTLIFSVSDDSTTNNIGIALSANNPVTLLTFNMQVKTGFTAGSTPLTFLKDPNDTISDNAGQDNTFATGALTATNGAVAIAAVPEPSQVALLGLLGGLGGARLAWRRRRVAA
jgi:Cohesin domain/PEP-CTERM motif